MVLTYTNQVHLIVIYCFRHFGPSLQNFEKLILTIWYCCLNSINSSLIFKNKKNFWCFVLPLLTVTKKYLSFLGNSCNIHAVEKNVLLNYRHHCLTFSLCSFSCFLAHLTLCSMTPNSWAVFLILQLLDTGVSVLIFSFPETSFDFPFVSSTGLSRSLQIEQLLSELVSRRFVGVVSNASANFSVNPVLIR